MSIENFSFGHSTSNSTALLHRPHVTNGMMMNYQKVQERIEVGKLSGAQF